MDKTTVPAYADDVTIFLTSAADITKLNELLQTFEQASAVKINTTKSQDLPLGMENSLKYK
jgi:hypothetical protein